MKNDTSGEFLQAILGGILELCGLTPEEFRDAIILSQVENNTAARAAETPLPISMNVIRFIFELKHHAPRLCQVLEEKMSNYTGENRKPMPPESKLTGAFLFELA